MFPFWLRSSSHETPCPWGSTSCRNNEEVVDGCLGTGPSHRLAGDRSLVPLVVEVPSLSTCWNTTKSASAMTCCGPIEGAGHLPWRRACLLMSTLRVQNSSIRKRNRLRVSLLTSSYCRMTGTFKNVFDGCTRSSSGRVLHSTVRPLKKKNSAAPSERSLLHLPGEPIVREYDKQVSL